VPSHDLSSIEGLEDKHLRVLARHEVTDLRGLAQADPEVIYRAMANLRPRPTRDLIARWQGEAGSVLSETGAAAWDETGPDPAEWQTAASFVVVFSQRRAGGSWEQRVGAERTEVEPERHPQVWSGWACEPICRWMLGELGHASGAGPANGTAGGPAQPAGEQAGVTEPVEDQPGAAEAAEDQAAQDQAAEDQAAEDQAAEDQAAEQHPAKPAPERPALRIDSATIIDATGRVDVLAAGAVVASPPREIVAPARVVFTVSGARPGTQLRAVTRVLRRDGPGWNARDPVGVPDSGAVEFDLSEVPAGAHVLDLVAWAPDATAKPMSITLPTMTIRSS
jgi:hypothetical protein